MVSSVSLYERAMRRRTPIGEDSIGLLQPPCQVTVRRVFDRIADTGHSALRRPNVRMSCVPGRKPSPPVALPTPRVRVSTEVHDCSMRLLDGRPFRLRTTDRRLDNLC